MIVVSLFHYVFIMKVSYMFYLNCITNDEAQFLYYGCIASFIG
jgi:hypothetical protein